MLAVVHGADIRGFLRSLALVALVVLLATGCGGQLPAAEPTDEPIDTFEPEDTFDDTDPTLPPQPTDATGLLDFGSGLPTNVETVLDSGIYGTQFAEGSFSSAGASRSCGGLSVYPRGLTFEFPHGLPTDDIQDVTFFAEELVPGTSTSSFQLSVSVANATIGSPDKTGLNTADGATGTATLNVDEEGARKLVADITGEGGISVHLEATCGPAGG